MVVRDTDGGSDGESAASEQHANRDRHVQQARKSHLSASGSRLRWGVRYGALGWSSGAGLLRSHVGGSVEEQGSVGM